MKLSRFWICLLALLLLAGCKPHAHGEPCGPASRELTAMDTYMAMTIYHQPREEAEQSLQQAVGLIAELDELLSVTDTDSELYRVNHSGGETVSLSEETQALLAEALALCKSTGGALDVTIYPVVRAWGFTTGDYRVPEQEELRALLEKVDYTQVALTEEGVTLPEGMELDLGAVAKGWTGDRLMELFRSAGCKDVTVKLYPGGRHEMFNETNRQEVFQDLLDWIESKLT